jgi:hypothetical protein
MTSHTEDDNLTGPVQTIHVEVAEMLWEAGEYKEGPRVLAQTTSYDKERNKIRDVYYYANGGVNVEMVMTRDADGQKIEGRRYDIAGSLHDRWVVYHDAEGKKREGYRFDANGSLLQRGVYGESSMTEGPEVEAESDDSLSGQESYTREFDSYGNWIKETTWARAIKAGQAFDEPTAVTYRKISYY